MNEKKYYVTKTNVNNVQEIENKGNKMSYEKDKRVETN